MPVVVDLSSDEEIGPGGAPNSARDEGGEPTPEQSHDKPSLSQKKKVSVDLNPQVELSTSIDVCNICHRRFSNLSNFLQHKRWHEEQANKREQKLKVKDVASSDTQNINKPAPVSANPAVGKCWICLARFTSDRQRKRHMKSHLKRAIKAKNVSQSSKLKSIIMRQSMPSLQDAAETNADDQLQNSSANQPENLQTGCLVTGLNLPICDNEFQENESLFGDQSDDISTAQLIIAEEQTTLQSDSMIDPADDSSNSIPTHFSDLQSTVNSKEMHSRQFEVGATSSVAEVSVNNNSLDQGASKTILQENSNSDKEANETLPKSGGGEPQNSKEQCKRDDYRFTLNVVDVVDMSQFIYKKPRTMFMCKFCLIRFSTKRRRINHELILHRKKREE